MRLRKYVFPRLASERIKLDGYCHCQSVFSKFVADFYRSNPGNLNGKNDCPVPKSLCFGAYFPAKPCSFRITFGALFGEKYSNRYRSVNHVSRRKTAACRQSPSLTNQGLTVKPTEKALATLSPKGAGRAGCMLSQDCRTAPRTACKHTRRRDPPCFSTSRYRRRHA